MGTIRYERSLEEDSTPPLMDPLRVVVLNELLRGMEGSSGCIVINGAESLREPLRGILIALLRGTEGSDGDNGCNNGC